MARTKTQLGEAVLEKAAVKIGPSEKNTAGEGGVFAYATSTSSQRFKVPAEWKDRWVTVQVETYDLEIVFGDSAVSATYGQASSVTSEVITTNDATGGHCFYGQEVDMFVEGRHTHFAIDAAGVGRVTMYPSSRKIQ